MINLLPRKEFQITLEDGKVIAGRFGTYCLWRFCEKAKCTLEEIDQKFTNPQIGDVFSLLLCAVEEVAQRNKAPFSYGNIDAADWIDQMGGLGSEYLETLFKHSSSEMPPTDSDQKKSTLVGENSKELVA